MLVDIPPNQSCCGDIPYLITSCPCHISDPLDTTVVAFLKYFQVSHQQSTAGEHEKAEVHAQRWSAPALLVGHGRQFCFGTQNELALSRETTNLPNDIVLGRLVLRLALCTPLRYSRSVKGCRNFDDDVCGEELGSKVGLHANAVLDLGLANLVYNSVDLEREVDVLGGSVAHEFEFAVGRDEGNDTVRVELSEFDTLVELAVLKGDTSSGCFGSLGAHPVPTRKTEQTITVEQQPVIQAKLAFRGAREVRAHDNLASHVCAQDSTCSRHEQVDILNDIDECFVLAIFDVGFAPGQCTRSLHSNLGRIFDSLFRLDTLGGDVHFQRVCLGILRVAEVDDLVEKFVDEDEVVLDGLLVELAKVSATQLDQTVQEFEDERSIGIALGDGHQVDVLVLDMAECRTAEGQNGRANLSVADDLDSEDIGESRATVVSEGSKD